MMSNCLWVLPENCIADILALTTPLDVCHLSLVSKPVRSLADSDSVWERFLPSDVVAGSLTPLPDFPSKKDLYVHLCHHPILIDGGRKSFSMEKRTGKKCYFLGARDLNIVYCEIPEAWTWTCLPESRFPEVADLQSVWWLEIWGEIRAGILSPQTLYAAYFVYKLKDEEHFDYLPSEVSIRICGVESKRRFCYLPPNGKTELEESPWTPREDMEQRVDPFGFYDNVDESDIELPKLRDDGWFEIELGQFLTQNDDDCIEMRMQEVKGGCREKYGLIVEGTEIRPKLG